MVTLLLDSTRLEIVLSGAELPEEKRAAVTRIQQELSALSQKFSENLLDASSQRG